MEKKPYRAPKVKTLTLLEFVAIFMKQEAKWNTLPLPCSQKSED